MIVTETTLGPSSGEARAAQGCAEVEERERETAGGIPPQCRRPLSPACPSQRPGPCGTRARDEVRLEKVWTRLHEIGFRVAIPAAVETEATGRPTLVYRRPNQFVGREIMLLQSTKK
jgi:hypothetical protein